MGNRTRPPATRNSYSSSCWAEAHETMGSRRPPTPGPTYSPAEWESIGLCIATEAIDGVVNHALLGTSARRDERVEATVWFDSRQNQELFLIRMQDLVSERGNPGLLGVDGSCLDVVLQASERCALGSSEGAAHLKGVTSELSDWLNASAALALWMPTLDVDVTLDVPRRQLLRVSGNQAKHNLARLTGIAEDLQGMLSAHGHVVPAEAIVLALDDFKAPLNEDFFLYHVTWIVEQLNEVRWGIHHYLGPTFRACYEPNMDRDRSYRYNFPTDVVSPAAREWFWRLMNLVRSGPNMARFRTPDVLKRPK